MVELQHRDILPCYRQSCRWNREAESFRHNLLEVIFQRRSDEERPQQDRGNLGHCVCVGKIGQRKFRQLFGQVQPTVARDALAQRLIKADRAGPSGAEEIQMPSSIWAPGAVMGLIHD